MDIPPVVRSKARAAGASAWVDGLPALVAALEREWSITVGAPYDGATEAYVARAVTADGTPAVLKLALPHAAGAEARQEITVLRLAGGDGCALGGKAEEAAVRAQEHLAGQGVQGLEGADVVLGDAGIGRVRA